MVLIERCCVRMKCPYRNFEDCIVEKCPSCVYEEIKTETIGGRYPTHMSLERALEEGYAWKDTKTSYKFISCKLVDNNVQPIPPKKEVINNTQKTSVVIRRSIF